MDAATSLESKGWFCPRICSSFEEGISSLRYDKTPNAKASLQKGEVRVAIRACGLNYFDLLTLVGRYQIPLEPPFCVTTEGSGVVVESNSSRFRPGDEVCAMSFGMCQEYFVTTDYVCVKKPERLTHQQAAAAYVGWITAYHGLVGAGSSIFFFFFHTLMMTVVTLVDSKRAIARG